MRILLLVVILSGLSLAPAASGAPLQLRLERPADQALFVGLPGGYTSRWWARLRNPPFCRFPLCHSSCASLERYWSADGQDAFVSLVTPCSLPTSDHSGASPEQGCCTH